MSGGRRLLVTVLGMVLISSGTYIVLSRSGSKVGPRPPPTATTPMFTLPGTIFVTQHGSIYTVHKGAVAKLKLSPATLWSHPAVTRDGTQLVVAGGDTRFTDLYLMSPTGEVGLRLTNDAAQEVAQNHWAFYPRFGNDGNSIFYSWDTKDPVNTFRVDLAVYSLDIKAGEKPPGRRWTQPDEFTGGDTAPQPVDGGGLLYAGYSIGPDRQIQSRIWWQTGPDVAGTPLTGLAANCGRPALSPAGDQLAMICSPAADRSRLVVAPFKDGVIGPPSISIDDQLVASPVWSPDGKGIAYLAAGKAGTGFDLWWVALGAEKAVAASPLASPSVASGRRQVTTGLDLDATSAPAWSPL